MPLTAMNLVCYEDHESSSINRGYMTDHSEDGKRTVQSKNDGISDQIVGAADQS